MKRVDLNITGRVQGVWFRYETQQVAEDLGLRGIVENMPDGSVHVIAEGDEKALNRLIEFCKHGPPLANVHHVDIAWGEAAGDFTNFVIRR